MISLSISWQILCVTGVRPDEHVSEQNHILMLSFQSCLQQNVGVGPPHLNDTRIPTNRSCHIIYRIRTPSTSWRRHNANVWNDAGHVQHYHFIILEEFQAFSISLTFLTSPDNGLRCSKMAKGSPCSIKIYLHCESVWLPAQQCFAACVCVYMHV